VAEFYSGLSVNITPIHWWIIAPVFSEALYQQNFDGSDLRLHGSVFPADAGVFARSLVSQP